MISGAEQYYFLSFGTERLQRTQDQFFQLTDRVSLDSASLGTIRLLISTNHQTNGTRWLMMMNTKMLIHGHRDLPVGEDVPTLRPSIISVLSEWSTRLKERFELNDLCMRSRTQWDVYVRNLTPEQAACLADDAQVQFIGEIEFRDLLLSL